MAEFTNNLRRLLLLTLPHSITPMEEFFASRVNPKPEDSLIVCNGRWIEQKCRNKPRALLFTVLTLFWVFPSVGALVIIGGGFARWFREPTLLEGFRAVAFEEWIGLALLTMHLVFGALAVHFRRNELPNVSVIAVENPDVNQDKPY